MATKKKSKKSTKSKLARHKKVMRAKHSARKTTAKKAPAKKRGPASKPRKRRQRRQQDKIFQQQAIASRSGAQSGDLQGLREIESADSESVEELAEEGNAFEAEAVAGVEHADDDAEREVHTHEVPEDDVPEEYLDKE
jgi:hypothetical protein